MNDWYKQKEKSAGKLRLLFLLYLYKILGKRALKLFLIPVVFIIWLKAKDLRAASKSYRNILNEYQLNKGLKPSRFCSFKHILFYAYSMVDKALAFMGEKVEIDIVKNDSYKKIKELSSNNKGILLLSSHLGNVEVLPALIHKMKIDRKNNNSKNKVDIMNEIKTINVLMNTSQTPIFHNFVSNHTKVSGVNIISTQNLDIGSGMLLSSILDNGEFLIIPSDRTTNESDKNIVKTTLLNKTIYLSKGIFRIVKLLEVNTFFMLCVYDGNKYSLEFRELNNKNDIENQFTRILEENVLKYPLNWFNFYSFFK